jgi:hypothetical protein
VLRALASDCWASPDEAWSLRAMVSHIDAVVAKWAANDSYQLRRSPATIEAPASV